MTTPAGTRLPAAERRIAIVEAALRVFSEGSYAGATTAQIAREAGVSEPILYRHFASKRDLYAACLDEAWRRIRARIEEKVEELGPVDGWQAIGPATMREMKVLVPSLWMQAITEAGEDPEIAVIVDALSVRMICNLPLTRAAPSPASRTVKAHEQTALSHFTEIGIPRISRSL